MTAEVSRRDVLIYLGTLAAASLSACAPAPFSPDHIDPATATPTITPTLPPATHTTEPTGTNTPRPTRTPEVSPYPEIHRIYQQLIADEIARHPETNRLKLLIEPLGLSQYSINHLASTIIPSASTIKAPILLYALTRQPDLPIYPSPGAGQSASDAYRMVVSSNNSATARVLASVASSPGQSLNEFNDFLHLALGWPSDTGLTRWGYYPVAGVVTDRVSSSAQFDNPLTLDLLADFYSQLENGSFGSITPLAQAVLSIPDPGYNTMLDLALARAQSLHPEVTYSYYGKNGTISPSDWSYPYWHIDEAAVVSLQSANHHSKYVLAYAASTFTTDHLLDLSLDYTFQLHRSGLKT